MSALEKMSVLCVFLFIMQLYTVVSHENQAVSCISRTSLSPTCEQVFVNLLQRGRCELGANVKGDYALRHPTSFPLANASQLSSADYVTLFEIPGAPLLIRDYGVEETWTATVDPLVMLKPYVSMVSHIGALTGLTYAVKRYELGSIRDFRSIQGSKKQLFYVVGGQIDAVVCASETVATL